MSETSVLAAAADEAQRLERERAKARGSGDWRAEIEASTELLQFYMQNADALGVDETSVKLDGLTADLVARIDRVLGSDQAQQDADERSELERTIHAIHAAEGSFSGYVASVKYRAAVEAARAAAAGGDPSLAREAAAALERASRETLARTEHATQGWPEQAVRNRDVIRDRAAVFLTSSAEMQVMASAAEAGGPLHPRQVDAWLKLVEVRLENAAGVRSVEAIRRDLRTGSLRTRGRNHLALAFSLLGLKMSRRAERSYARTAAQRPKSAELFARARREREAATTSLEKSEVHRQASQAALDAPVARPWIASVVQFVFGWVLLGIALTVNYVVFAAFDVNYFHWYLDNGALISLVFGFVSLAVRLDDYPDLVSSNPMRYAQACLTLTVHLFAAWNQVVGVDTERAAGIMLSKVFDAIVSFVAWLAITVAFVGWLLVVAPLQHIAYAILGAPARNALRNPVRPTYDPEADKTTLGSTGGVAGGHAIGYVEKPVALTSALTAAVLWVVSQFV